MGFKIKLNNINVPSGNEFKVFYKLNSRTPGNVAYQSDLNWGTLYGSYVGGVNTDIEIDFTTIDPNPYGKQNWFKILDLTTGSYIIENIYIHQYQYYKDCNECCVYEGGNAIYIPNPTPTPTPTNTPVPTPTPTSSSTPTPTPSGTPVPTPTPTPTSTPTPTPIPPTPTPTSTSVPPPPGILVMGSCSNANYTSSSIACFNSTTCRGYYVASGLMSGAILYEDSYLTTPFDGNNYWFKLSYLGSGNPVAVQVNDNGVISNVTNC
jgi:hypothetical protein